VGYPQYDVSHASMTTSTEQPWRSSDLESVGMSVAPSIPSGFDFRYGQVYRWAYDYSVPGAEQDFVPQNQRAVARAA
jgi:cytochrome c oxidase subunit I